MKHPHSDLVAKRVIEQASLPLWSEGPTFADLIKQFVNNCADAAHLDSWIPFSNPGMRDICIWYFQGAAYRLAELLAVHFRTAGIALALACLGLRGTDNKGAMEAALSMVPTLDKTKQEEGFHLLGAKVAEDWLATGLGTQAPTASFLWMIGLIEKNALPEALDPLGLAREVASTLTRSKAL